jgi:hypothetical protein
MFELGNRVTRKRKRGVQAGPRLSLLALAVLAFMAFSAAPAHAARTHRLITAFHKLPAGVEPFYTNIAVNESNGNLFIASFTLGSSAWVAIQGPEGGAPTGVANDEIAGVRAQSLAFDNSASSPSHGALYVSEEHGVVKKFVLDPLSQEYVSAGELVATPPLTYMYGQRIDVDANGNVFVVDVAGKGVVEFDPAGTQIARLDVSASIGGAGDIAVDSAGDLIVSGSSGSVYRFDANGAGEIEPGTVPVQIYEGDLGGGSVQDFIVDQDSDVLYLLTHLRVLEFSAFCTPQGVGGEEEHCVPEGEFGDGIIGTGGASMAVNAAQGYIYVRDNGGGYGGADRQIDLFGPTVIVPGSTTGEATGVTGTTATLHGTVDPSGSLLDECRFEWGPDQSYANTAPCAESPAAIGTGNAAVLVHADLSGLGIGNEIHFRLVATSPTTVPDEKGPSVGADSAFTTLGPQVRAESASKVGATTATLEGLVNPKGETSTAFFEYVSHADFEAGEYTNATSVPLGGKAVGSGNVDVAVVEEISGLSPHTTYHFRLSATNASGTAHGPGATFQTYIEAGPGLPDARAYEQATPLNKGGVNPRGETNLVRAGSGEGGITGITFTTNGGVPGSEGSQRFPTYLSRRAADGSGWTTQGLLPPAANGPVAVVRGYSDNFSQTYVTQATDQLTPGAFYQRDTLTLQMREMIGGVPDEARADYAGETADGSTVLLEVFNEPPLPSGATKGLNTYVWDKQSGAAILAGALNNSKAPSGGTSPGSYTGHSGGKYTLYENAISEDGSRVFFSSNDAKARQVYLRQNPTQPQSEMAGGQCTEAALACTLQISASQRTIAPLKDEKPSTLWLATPDGTQAFFTSPGKLTDDATTGATEEGADLYRYEAESGELTDLTVDTNPGDPSGADVQGVLGASADGSYVYFVANGVLTATPNAEGLSAEAGDCKAENPELLQNTIGRCNLYLWHEGEVSFIAPQQAKPSANAEPTESDAMNWMRKPAGTAGERTARVSSDGQTLLFRSREKLSAYDNAAGDGNCLLSPIPACNEFYRYDAEAGELACVSCNPTGAPPVGFATLESMHVGIADSAPASTQTRNLSADGDRVFFESPERLVVADTNGVGGCPPVRQGILSGDVPACQDVYEWEAKGSGSCESEAENGGCLYLLSSGTSPEPSYFGDASRSGDDTYVFTSEPLVAQDQDALIDIYDARVGGGIAAQNALPAPICEAEGCKPAVGATPGFPTPGTPGFLGQGNPLYCKKGFKKASRHGETVCVKKKPHAKKKKKRQKHRAGGRQK